MKNYVLAISCGSFLAAAGQNFTAGTHFSNYYDVFPDTLLTYQTFPYTHETFSMNIFGSSAYDYRIDASGAGSSGGSSAYISITSLNPNMYMLFGRLDSLYVPGNPVGNKYYVTKVAKPLHQGDVINAPGAVWNNDTLYLIDHWSHSGGTKTVNDFVGGDKYIGLKYVNVDYFNGNTEYYGWIWVNCPNADSCYVKEYSGQSKVAVTGITAVGGSSGLEIFPNPVRDHFYLKDVTGQGFNLSSLKVQDVSGREVPFTSNRTQAGLEVRLAELPPGFYMVNGLADNDAFTRKIIKVQ